MNTRQQELLRILSTQKDNFLRIDFLADQLQCSEKTVRTDLKHIEEQIRGYGDLHLIRKPGFGVHLDIDEDSRIHVFQRLYEKTEKSVNERLMEIAYMLLTSNNPATLRYLATNYYTNMTVIKADFEKIKSWLDRFGLTIVSKQRVGSHVVGNELAKRNALAHLSELSSSVPDKRKEVLDLFQLSEIAIVRKRLAEMQQQFQLSLTDGGFESLQIHALIMISRIRKKAVITLGETSVIPLSEFQTKEYEMTNWFLDKLESRLQVKFPTNERIYFAWHVRSSKKSTLNAFERVDTVSSSVTEALIEQVQKLTMANFQGDSLLREGLVIHLDSVINRVTYGFTITNPLLSDIKKLYPYMFSMLILAVEEINKQYQIAIPEDEAAYLVLHFQASIERLTERTHVSKRILVVCHLGVGMSQLLKAKLDQQYQDINIIDMIGKMEVKQYLENHSIDLIISTVPLKNDSIPFVVISPLLEKNDKEKVDNYLQKLEQEAASDELHSQLGSLVKQDIFFPHVTLKHRFEIVELLANGLFERGFVEKDFIHSAMLRERESATSIGSGVAIPHAQPELVKHSCVAMAIIEAPLEWGNEMVSVVFLLAISNQDKRLTKGVIQHISNITKNPETVDGLIKAENVSEVISLLVE